MTRRHARPERQLCVKHVYRHHARVTMWRTTAVRLIRRLLIILVGNVHIACYYHKWSNRRTSDVITWLLYTPRNH